MTGIRFDIDNQLANELRDRVLVQVAIGETDPAAAEKFAYETEIGPISFMPDPGVATDEDLLGLDYWTMGMAVAWIAWKRLDAVRECYLPYAQTRRSWVRLPNTMAVRRLLEPLGLKRGALPGFIIARGAPASICGMVARERRGMLPLPYLPTPGIPVGDALAIVVAALMKSDPLLVAHADSVATGSTEALSPAAWATLAAGVMSLPPGANVDWTRDAEEIDFLYTGDALFRVPHHSGAAPAYTGARMERQRVQYLANNLHLLVSEPTRQLEMITVITPDSIDVASALESVPATPRKTRSLRRESQYIYGWFMKNYGEISDTSVAAAKGQGSWRALATRITQDGKKNRGADLEIAEPDVHQFLDTMRNRGMLTKPANPAKPS